MKYKVVLFDADGVTLKEDKYFSEYLAEQGLISSLDKTTPFFNGVFQDCLLGKADLKEELAKVIDKWGWEGTVDELVDYWFTVGDDLNEDVVSYINDCKKNNIRCYMTADQEKYRAAYLRRKLSHLFEDFFFAGEIGYAKKEPECFEYVYGRVGQFVNEKSEILFIDDMEHNVTNARAFGIEAIHFRTIADLPEIRL